jgi:hypothetical protein
MLFPALVGELSLLELIVFLMLTLYWLWYRYGHSHYQTLYRYTSLNGRSFALPALVLSHFSHPSTLHLLWGLYGVWTTMANMYSNVGGRLFWPTLVFAISVQSLFKVGYDLLVRRGSRVTATYGLQQLLVFSNIVSMMVYHTGSLADFNLLGIEFLRAQVQLLLVEGIFSESS